MCSFPHSHKSIHSQGFPLFSLLFPMVDCMVPVGLMECMDCGRCAIHPYLLLMDYVCLAIHPYHLLCYFLNYWLNPFLTSSSQLLLPVAIYKLRIMLKLLAFVHCYTWDGWLIYSLVMLAQQVIAYCQDLFPGFWFFFLGCGALQRRRIQILCILLIRIKYLVTNAQNILKLNNLLPLKQFFYLFNCWKFLLQFSF